MAEEILKAVEQELLLWNLKLRAPSPSYVAGAAGYIAILARTYRSNNAVLLSDLLNTAIDLSSQRGWRHYHRRPCAVHRKRLAGLIVAQQNVQRTLVPHVALECSNDGGPQESCADSDLSNSDARDGVQQLV